MNARLYSAPALTVLAALVFTGSAFAANAANKGTMQLLSPATVAGKQLAPGVYNLQWEGNGSQVNLQILQGKKAVASTAAHVVNLEKPVPENQVLVVPNSDGSMTLSQINFRKKDFALEIDRGSGGGAGAAGSAK